MAAHQITYCPPRPAHGVLEQEPSFVKPKLPVSAHFEADGEAHGNGISFQDYEAMQTQTKALFKGRHAPPSWAVNLRELKLLLARYIEKRALVLCPRIDTPERRTVFAQRKTLKEIPALISRLDRLSEERMALIAAGGDPDRISALTKIIRSLDGEIIAAQKGPVLVCGVIHHFFRCGLSSAETSAALNHMISPPNVRQMASRLEKTWKQMQDGTDKKPTPREFRRAHRHAYYEMTYKPVQLAKEKAERAAETPEEREKRLAYARAYYQRTKEYQHAKRKADPRMRERALAKYHGASPEEVKARSEKYREYCRTHGEQRRAVHRAWYVRNRAAAVLTPEQREARNKKERDLRRDPKKRPIILARQARYRAERKSKRDQVTFSVPDE